MNKTYGILFIIIFYCLRTAPLYSQTIFRGSVREIRNGVKNIPRDSLNVNLEINDASHFYETVRQGEFKFSLDKKIYDNDRLRLTIDSTLYKQTNYLAPHLWKELNNYNSRIVIHIQKKISIPISRANYKKSKATHPPEFTFIYAPKLEVNINVNGMQNIASVSSKIEIEDVNAVDQIFLTNFKRITENIKSIISKSNFKKGVYNLSSLDELFEQFQVVLDSFNVLEEITQQYITYLKENNRSLSKRLDSLGSKISATAFWGDKINDTRLLIEDSALKYSVTDDGEILYNGRSFAEIGYNDIIFPPKEGISRTYNTLTKKYSFINSKARKLITRKQFDYAEDFNDSLALISNKSKYDFIDHSGTLAFHPDAPGYEDYDLNYLNAISFRNNRALVRDTTGIWYFINTKNKRTSRDIEKINYLEKGISDARWDINTNYIWIKYDYYVNQERNFFINTKGKRVSKIYHNVIGFNDSLVCIVSEDNRWMIINNIMKNLLRRISYSLDSIHAINNYLFAIRKTGGKNWGIISCSPTPSGQSNRDIGIIDDDFKYSAIRPTVDNSMIVINTIDRYGVIRILANEAEIEQNKGEISQVIYNKFDEIIFDERTNQYEVSLRSMSWIVNSNGKVDVIHSQSSIEEYKKYNR